MPQWVVYKGGSTAVPQDPPAVSDRLRHRGGLPEVSGSLPLAGWVHLSAMRAPKSVRIGESKAPPMRQMPAPGFADIRDSPSPDQDSADPCLVEAGFEHVTRIQPLRSELRKGAKSAVTLADRAIGNLQQ